MASKKSREPESVTLFGQDLPDRDSVPAHEWRQQAVAQSRSESLAESLRKDIEYLEWGSDGARGAGLITIEAVLVGIRNQGGTFDCDTDPIVSVLVGAARRETNDFLRDDIYKLLEFVRGKEFVARLRIKVDAEREYVRRRIMQDTGITSLLSELPENAEYDVLIEHLARLNHEFREGMAARLEPALNTRVQAMTHNSYEEKKQVATWVNAQTDRLGLALKCPKTGLAARLRAQTGNWPKIGRFAFEIQIDGKRKTPAVSDKLPFFQLVDANPSREPEDRWKERIGPRETRPGRKLT